MNARDVARGFLCAVAFLGVASTAAPLHGDAPSPHEVVFADDLSADEREAARAAWALTVRLAVAPAGHLPPRHAAEASGVLASAEGHVATTERFVRRAERLPAGLALYGRVGDGPWVPATVVGRAWFARLGVVRLATASVPYPSTPFAPSPRQPRARLVAAALGSGPRVEVRAAPVERLVWVDPSVAGARFDVRRGGADREPGKAALVVGLRTARPLAGRGADGTPVFLGRGGCAGLVVGVDEERPAAEALRIVPGEVVSPWVERIVRDGAFDLFDLGLTLLPVPVEAGDDAAVPSDLEALRRTSPEKGGAIAVELARRSPAAGRLWPGDVVLEINGRALVGEVAETHALAAATLVEGVPADVVVWRGRRETVSVTPVRARTLYPDLGAVLDVRAARLSR